VPAFKNVESLLFQQDLLIPRQILRQLCSDLVGHANNAPGDGIRNQLGAGRSLHAVRRKDLKFRIVGRVKVSVRHQKNPPAARRVRKPPDIRQQFLRSRRIELSSGHHEINLRINFP
jgi:hypothetical protein